MDPEQLPSANRVGLFTKLLIKVAGVDEETLCQCPARDWEHVRATGGITLFTWAYLSALFCLTSHHLFAAQGRIEPGLVLGSLFLGSFIIATELQLIVRPSWFLGGLQELARGGLQIPIGLGVRIKAGFAFLVRTLMALAFAQVGALIVALVLFGPDVEDRVQHIYQQQNAHLIGAATAMVDAQMRRATDAFAAETQRASALSVQVLTLREIEIDPSAGDPQTQQAQQELAQLIAERAKADDEVRSAEAYAADELAGIRNAPGNSGHAGNGPNRRAALERVANAKQHAVAASSALEAARGRLAVLRNRLASTAQTTKQQSHAQLPAFASALADENAKLAELKNELARLTDGRDEAIGSAVQNAPDYVAPNNGLLAQITALDDIARDNPKLTAVVLLIDAAAFSLELAVVASKTFTWIPTTYSMLLARDAYMQSVRIVDGMMEELHRSPAPSNAAARVSAPGKPANDNRPSAKSNFAATIFGAPDDPQPQPPPKRPRGRPRKNSVN